MVARTEGAILNVRETEGKPIVSMSDGARVGQVTNTVIDGQRKQIKGFLLGSDHGEGFLPLSSVRAFGHDAITIDTTEKIEWNVGKIETPEKRASDLLNLTIVDASGTVIGHVEDVLFSESGDLEEVRVKGPGLFGHHTTIPGTRVRAIGQDLMTVEEVQ